MKSNATREENVDRLIRMIVFEADVTTTFVQDFDETLLLRWSVQEQANQIQLNFLDEELFS
jgi:hypothetical protein